MFIRIATTVAAVAFVATTAQAAPSSQMIAGHSVEVVNDGKGNEALKVDAKILHRNASVSIDQVESLGDLEVAIGSSSTGGNACDAPPFVLSFAKGRKPRLDGPIHACKTVTYKVQGDRIRFESKALEGDDGEAWLWTPAHGFKAAGHVKHVPDSTKGWSDLSAHHDLHPSELLDLGEVATSLLDLIGKDRQAVLPVLNGVGSGEFVGDLYVGTSCRPHACPDAGVLVVGDPKKKKLYVAWKLERRKIVQRTDDSDWPPNARAEFEKWAKQWH
jgi:hypothetical protein